MFDDFRLMGCWNWLLYADERGKFEELFYRYNAHKRLGIRTKLSLEEFPATTLDELILIDNELEKARWQRQKSENTK